MVEVNPEGHANIMASVAVSSSPLLSRLPVQMFLHRLNQPVEGEMIRKNRTGWYVM